MKVVLAHAIASNQYDFMPEEGLVGIDMTCEYEDGQVKTATIWFNAEDLPAIEAYYKSPKGIEPLELYV